MIYDEILETIRRDYEDGMTQDALAKKYKVSQVHIHQLLSGKRSAAKMELETFMKMFPRAMISLDGHTKPVPEKKAEEEKDDIKSAILMRYDKLLPHERIQLLGMVDEFVRSKNQPSKSIGGVYAS